MNKKQLVELLKELPDEEEVFISLGDDQTIFFGKMVAAINPRGRIIFVGELADVNGDKPVILS